MFKGVVRRFERFGNGLAVPPSTDEFGNLAVSPFLPPYAALVAAGKVFAVDMHAGTAIAPVTAMPVASPAWGLYNASPNESLVLLKAACSLKSGTAGLGLAIVGAAAKGPQTAVAADYTGTIKGCLDGSRRIPDVYLTSNPTLLGDTPPWVILASTKVNTVATDSVGDGLEADVNGLLIARPNGGAIGFEVVGEVGTTALFTVSFVFAMLPLEHN